MNQKFLFRYLDHGGRGLLCHVMDGILIPQPVRSFHSVVEMPPPVVLFHVSKSSIDASLGTPCQLFTCFNCESPTASAAHLLTESDLEKVSSLYCNSLWGLRNSKADPNSWNFPWLHELDGWLNMYLWWGCCLISMLIKTGKGPYTLSIAYLTDRYRHSTSLSRNLMIKHSMVPVCELKYSLSRNVLLIQLDNHVLWFPHLLCEYHSILPLRITKYGNTGTNLFPSSFIFYFFFWKKSLTM